MRDAGINVCCGGIVGMGEAREDRVGMIAALANLPVHPESVPINMLVKVEGTPLADGGQIDPLEFVRTIAVARITMPAVGGAALGRPRGHERGDAGALLSRRRELDLLRAEAADHAQSGTRSRHATARQARHAADALTPLSRCSPGTHDNHHSAAAAISTMPSRLTSHIAVRR